MLEEKIGRRHTNTEVFSLISNIDKKHALVTDIIVVIIRNKNECCICHHLLDKKKTNTNIALFGDFLKMRNRRRRKMTGMHKEED